MAAKKLQKSSLNIFLADYLKSLIPQEILGTGHRCFYHLKSICNQGYHDSDNRLESKHPLGDIDMVGKVTQLTGHDINHYRDGNDYEKYD